MLWTGCGAVEGSGKVKKKQGKVAVWFEVSSMEVLAKMALLCVRFFLGHGHARRCGQVGQAVFACKEKKIFFFLRT